MIDASSASTPLPAAKPRRSRGRRLLLALLIFLGGALCGAAVASILVVRSIHYAIQHPEEAPGRITARLARRLDLTDAQSQQVREIVARRQAALMGIRRDVQPRVEVELTRLEEEIAVVLNDSQRATWRTLARTFRAQWLPPAAPTSAPATLP